MPLIPVYDKNPLHTISFYWATSALIVFNALMLFPSAGLTLDFGFIPRDFLDNPTDPATAVTLISYAFLHADWWHLLGNLLFLWVFGDNVEDALGHWRFLGLYFLCALAGSLAHLAANPGQFYPLVGASGAISGIAAAYALLYPKAAIYGLIWKIPAYKAPAAYVIGAWILFQIVMFIGRKDPTIAAIGGAGVSWEAHLGGILVGFVLAKPLMKNAPPDWHREANEASTQSKKAQEQAMEEAAEERRKTSPLLNAGPDEASKAQDSDQSSPPKA